MAEHATNGAQNSICHYMDYILDVGNVTISHTENPREPTNWIELTPSLQEQKKGWVLKMCDKDHALRCVKIAMEMQTKMDELRQGWKKMAYDELLNIRIGINTGWATVGNFGSEDRLNYTALGSGVNLASRIENACAPGRITISHGWILLFNCIGFIIF